MKNTEGTRKTFFCKCPTVKIEFPELNSNELIQSTKEQTKHISHPQERGGWIFQGSRPEPRRQAVLRGVPGRGDPHRQDIQNHGQG